MCESVIALRDGREVAEDGYKGDYVADLAAGIPSEIADQATAARTAGAAGSDDDEVAVIGRWASERIRRGIQSSLASLGVEFDVWKSEASLHREGWVDRAVEHRVGGEDAERYEPGMRHRRKLMRGG